jgi:hypothetical protein
MSVVTRPSTDVDSVDVRVWASALNSPRAERVRARSETLGGGAGEAGAPPGRGARERSLGGGVEPPKIRAEGPP